MLAGAWMLVLMPLMDLLLKFESTANLRVPTVFDFRGDLTLGTTFLSTFFVYQSLVFCMGMVLLFSRERGRRDGRLDWTRRWGVLCSYIVLLLCAVNILLITALVTAGIGAIFLSIPLRYQPGVTQLFVDASFAYLRYGPYPRDICGAVLVGFSSSAVLLACMQFFNALRSSGPRWLSAILLLPLAMFSLMNLVLAGRSCCFSPSSGPGGFPSEIAGEVYSLGLYFRPGTLVSYMFDEQPMFVFIAPTTLGSFIVEATKWSVVLAVAVWLTISQIAAWRNTRRKQQAI